MHPMHPRELEKSTCTVSRAMLSRRDSDLQPPSFLRAIIDLARHNKAVYHMHEKRKTLLCLSRDGNQPGHGPCRFNAASTSGR
jgi:hypothetical protein